MNNQLKRPHDESDLSLLKEIPAAIRGCGHETSTSVNNFPERFWDRCDETLHPLELGLGVGLIVGILLTLLCMGALKNKKTS